MDISPIGYYWLDGFCFYMMYL